MRGLIARLGVLAGLAVLCISGSASAATLKVTETGDPAPGACTNNDCTLREAVRRANSTGGADKIVLKARTYQLTQPGVDDDAIAGDLDVLAGSGRLTIVGKGPGRTAIDGNDIDSVLQILEGARASIRELTVRNGTAPVGGVIANAGTLSLSRAAVREGSALAGGGVHNSGSGRLTVSRTVIAANLADAVGGGIHNLDEARATLARSRVVGNDSNSSAGGIYNEDDARMTIQRVRIAGNEADVSGGGVYNQNDARMAIARTTIAGNGADYGGGVYNQNDAQARIKTSTISGNAATQQGGGIYDQNDSLLVLTNTTISGNRADTGGGIYGQNYPYIRINFSTIAKNSATSSGGAIFSGTAGNNISRPPPFWLMRGTIVAKNSSPGVDNCALDVVSDPTHFDSQGSNLEDENTCFFTRGSDQRNAAAKLRKLKKNGGPTKTHALKPSSDAVDAAKKPGSPNRDQRGVKRPQGNKPDIGSYELKQR